jgi:hypothetical protein
VDHVVQSALVLQEHLVAQLREGKEDPSDVLKRMSRVASLENELLGTVRGHITARPGEMLGSGMTASPFDAEFIGTAGSAETFGATVLREMMTGVRQFVANTQTPQIINSIKSARSNGLEKLAVHLERQLYEDLGVEQGEKIMPTVLEDGHILGARGFALSPIGSPAPQGDEEDSPACKALSRPDDVPSDDLFDPSGSVKQGIYVVKSIERPIRAADGTQNVVLDLEVLAGAEKGRIFKQCVALPPNPMGDGRNEEVSIGIGEGVPLEGRGSGCSVRPKEGWPPSGPPYLCAVCHKVEVDAANGIDTCPDCIREEKRQRIG